MIGNKIHSKKKTLCVSTRKREKNGHDRQARMIHFRFFFFIAHTCKSHDALFLTLSTIGVETAGQKSISHLLHKLDCAYYTLKCCVCTCIFIEERSWMHLWNSFHQHHHHRRMVRSIFAKQRRSNITRNGITTTSKRHNNNNIICESKELKEKYIK